MVFTVRYILGILLVLISCSAIHAASIRSRSIRETSETQVPKNESHSVATTTEPPSTTHPANIISDTKLENDTKTENITITTEPTPESTLDVAFTTENVDNKTDHLDGVTEVSEIVNATTTEIPVTESIIDVTTESSIDATPTNIIDATTIINEPSEAANLISNTTENSTEIKQQGRTENGRSLDFDISKYTSPEFHNKNNVYNLPTSPENEKYVSSYFDQEVTTLKPKPTELTKFTHTSELTTPVSEYFDARFHEVEHGVAQDLEAIDHYFETQTPKPDKPTSLNDIIEKAKRNDTESNLDFLRYTSVINDNKEDKNSVHKSYENEERLKINFDSVYNDTKVINEEILVTSESPITLTTTEMAAKVEDTEEKIEKVSFVTTTRRTLPTKFSLVNRTLDQNSLLNNKIETETIKPVERPKEINSKERVEKPAEVNNQDKETIEFNRSPEENIISVSKRGSTKFVEKETVAPTVSSDKNISVTSEQNLEENNIYAFLVTTSTPETTTPRDLPETTETMYEITDERFEATTEAVTNTKRGRDLATTIKTSEEVFYEMTTESTTVASTTESDFFTTTEMVTMSPQRFITDASLFDDVVSTTEENLLSSTEAPEITISSNLDVTNSTEIFEDLITTENPIESTTFEMKDNSAQGESTTEYSLLLNTSAVADIVKANTSESFTPVTEVEERENISESPVTIAEIEMKNISETNISETTTPISSVVTENIIIKNISSTSTPVPNTTTIITATEADFDDDDDDEYIDFSNRKVNSSSGHEEIDVLNPEVPEETTTVSSIIKPTLGIITTTLKERKEIVDLTIASANKLPATTPEGITEREEFTETMTESSEGSGFADAETSDGTVIAITISTIGAVCLVLLAVLLFIMRRRQKKFNYGQRCTPVSLDSYSMDNVSVYNSVRRKTTIRDSKRSYGNPAFDDATVSQPLNFQALVKYANSLDEIATEFEAIPMVTARMSELPEGCEVKNRYANVIPLPETRVVLSPTDDDPTGDYINANYVTGPKGVRGYYIACQAPLSNTVNDFWRMIWEQQSRVILMLTHLFETGVEKCVDYLPPSEVLDCHRLFGDYQVTLKKREVKDKYIISSLQLKNMVTNSWREVTHLWYSGWPEKGVPSEENSIIAFLIEARSFVKLVQNSTDLKVKDSTNGGIINSDASPVVVHCSPGTGRTGTVIACDIAIREFELKRLVDIPRIVYRIRRDRASSVQTKDQYTFIYRVINLYATKLTGGALDSI